MLAHHLVGRRVRVGSRDGMFTVIHQWGDTAACQAHGSGEMFVYDVSQLTKHNVVASAIGAAVAGLQSLKVSSRGLPIAVHLLAAAIGAFLGFSGAAFVGAGWLGSTVAYLIGGLSASILAVIAVPTFHTFRENLRCKDAVRRAKTPRGGFARGRTQDSQIWR